MERHEITYAFIQQLDNLQTKYNCTGKELCEKLGKNNSYISHIKRRKISRIKPATVASIAKIISESAKEMNSELNPDEVEKEVYNKLTFTFPDCYMVNDFKNYIEQPHILNNKALTDSIQEMLNDLNYSAEEFVKNVVNKKETVEIIYDFTNQKKIITPHYDANYFSEILTQKRPATYDDMFVFLYCMIEQDDSIADPETETFKFLLDTTYPSLTEHIDYVYTQSELLELYSSNERFNNSLPDKGIERLQEEKIIYALAEIHTQLGDSYSDFRDKLYNVLTDSNPTSLYRILKKGIIPSLLDLISEQEDETQLSFLDTLNNNLSYPNPAYITSIYGNDYTKLRTNKERNEFLNSLHNALNK